MVIFLFALVLFLSDIQPVASALRSPGRVKVDADTSARASSDSLDHDSRVPGLCQRHQAYPCLRYTKDELLTLDGHYVCSAQLAAISEAVLRLRRAGQPAPKKRAKYLDSARRLERLHNDLASGQRGMLQFLDACSAAVKL